MNLSGCQCKPTDDDVENRKSRLFSREAPAWPTGCKGSTGAVRGRAATSTDTRCGQCAPPVIVPRELVHNSTLPWSYREATKRNETELSYGIHSTEGRRFQHGRIILVGGPQSNLRPFCFQCSASAAAHDTSSRAIPEAVRARKALFHVMGSLWSVANGNAFRWQSFRVRRTRALISLTYHSPEWRGPIRKPSH